MLGRQCLPVNLRTYCVESTIFCNSDSEITYFVDWEYVHFTLLKQIVVTFSWL
jgi:hypothetical protein